MKIAVFVETYTPTMGADHRQVMMIPHNDTVRVFTRLSDGNKGYGNRWDESDIETVVNAMDASESITCIPSGVRLTAKDIEALDLKGYAPVLMTKAVNAHLKALPFNEETDAAERICALYQDVSVQSSSLEDLIIDLRSQAPASPFLPQSAPTQTSTANNLDELPRVALASIPPMDRAKAYISRDIVGIQDLEVYDKARANKFDVLIYGPTGPGKTSSVVAWAASRKLRMATVSGNAALEPSQLIGKYIPDGKGGFVWIDGPVTDVVRNGGVLCLDEVNFISPKIYTVLYSLLDDRRCLILLDHMGETVEAHPDLTIFATMNPNYIGTTPLNFAFRNRYVVQIPWDYDDKVEDKLVKSQALKVLKNQLRAEANKGEFETPISTNMLMEFEKLVKVFSFEFAVENFIAHFELEEQDKVRLVFTTHEYNLKSDFDLVEVLDQDKGEDSEGLGEKIATEAENWLSSNNTPTNP
jgi:hypothetical protein